MADIRGNIGLVAWGLKLGKDVFFTSDNINANAAEIVRTLEDARGIINMLNANQIFYSLEFTNEFKVYTIYKTINDWGNRNNAYLALSLFIPSKVRFDQGVIPVLKKLISIYDEFYLDENLRIKRGQERKELFFNAINEFSTNSIGWAPPRPNKDSNTEYAHIRYLNEIQLEEFFDNPFFEEYAPFKEIFFLENGNDKINGVKGLPLLEVKPRPLFRKIRFELRDEGGRALPMQYSFSINNTAIHSSTYTYEIQGNEKELSIRIEKTGYKSVLKKYHLDDEVLASGHLVIQLEKRKEASIKVVDEKQYGPLSKASVRFRTKGVNIWTLAKPTNENGETLLNGIYVDDDIVVHVECEGFEPKELSLHADENKLFPIRKKEHIASEPINNSGNTGFVSGKDSVQPRKSDLEKNSQEKNAQNEDKTKITNKKPFKLNYKRAGLVGGGLLGVVLIVFLVTSFINQQRTSSRIKEVKLALSDSLKVYHTIAVGNFDAYISRLDTSKLKVKYVGKFNEFKSSLDNEKKGIEAGKTTFQKKIDDFTSKNINKDSLLLGNSIKDHYSQIITNNLIQNDKIDTFFMQVQNSLAQEQLRLKQEQDRIKQDTDKQKYRQLAETMCNNASNTARSYANIVDGNSMGYSPSEKNILRNKFLLIEKMLNLDHTLRRSSDQEAKFNSKEELKRIRDQVGRSLSTEQKNWLNTSITSH